MIILMTYDSPYAYDTIGKNSSNMKNKRNKQTKTNKINRNLIFFKKKVTKKGRNYSSILENYLIVIVATENV